MRHKPIPILAGLIFAAAAFAIGVSAADDEFFIVSSVDASKSTMIVKRPTEVTLVMHVTPKTRCWNEAGKPIRFTDLRAGDTVFIEFAVDSSNQAVASSVRQGIMTLPELRRRYLRLPRS